MNDFDHDIISRYLDGEMNSDEQKDFEQQMQEDEALLMEVELTREVNETLTMKLHPDQSEQNVRNTLGQMREQYFSKEVPGNSLAKVIVLRRTRWISALAAAAILILILTIWSPWKKDLFQQYAYIQMPGIAERGGPADSMLKQAALEFNNKNFANALPLFESILKRDPKNSLVHFYYGIALLQSNQVEKARNEFTLLYNGASIFQYDAAFYMALIYLKQKDKTKAKEWLNKIPEGADIYSKAGELNKKL